MTRKSIISSIRKTAAKLAVNVKQGNLLTWQLAEQLFDLRGTFAQGSEQQAAYLATATTASGKNEASVKNLVRAIEVRNSLTAKQRQEVAAWSYDAVLALAKPDSRQRTSIISKAAKQGSDAKTVRKIKTEVVGRTEREEQTAAAKTTKLAEQLAERFADAVKSGHDPLAMIVGAQMAQDNPGKDVAAALLFLHTQAAAAASVVAAS